MSRNTNIPKSDCLVCVTRFNNNHSSIFSYKKFCLESRSDAQQIKSIARHSVALQGAATVVRGASAVPVWAGVVVDRFPNSVEEETNPHPASKQHAEPGPVWVLHFIVIFT